MTTIVIDDHRRLESVGMVCLCGKPLATFEGVAKACACGRIWVISAMQIGRIDA